ncbi:MAG: two-component regulator propeller domain-containing protein [Acidobacteriota bacterium]
MVNMVGKYILLTYLFLNTWGVSLLAMDNPDQQTLAGHKILKLMVPPDGNEISSLVKVIFEDKDGNYWLGTHTTLYFFDENKNYWKSVKSDSGKLTINQVTIINQSNDGKIWFAPTPNMPYFGSGIICFDGTRWSKINGANSPLKFFDDNGNTSPVYAIFPGKSGILWFALEDGLIAYDNGKWISRLKPSLNFNEVEPIDIITGLQDSQGYLWLVSPSIGILGYDVISQKWAKYDPLSENQITLNKSHHNKIVNVSCIYEDRQGLIWFLTVEGIAYVYNKEKRLWQSVNIAGHVSLINTSVLANFRVNQMYQDKNGVMMFATNHGLLVYFDKGNRWELLTYENSKLPSSYITTIMEDHNQRIWLGTARGVVVLE